MIFFVSLCHLLDCSSIWRNRFSFTVIYAHSSVSFLFFLLQRNDKREVDNTQKIYLIDTALENLSHVTDH